MAKQGGQECPTHTITSLGPPSHTTLTKTKTNRRSGWRGRGARVATQDRNTIRSTTSPSFLLRGGRSLTPPSCRSKSQKDAADFAPGKKSGIQNMGKERFISGREKAKRSRLRYNSLASA